MRTPQPRTDVTVYVSGLNLKVAADQPNCRTAIPHWPAGSQALLPVSPAGPSLRPRWCQAIRCRCRTRPVRPTEPLDCQVRHCGCKSTLTAYWPHHDDMPKAVQTM